MKNATQNKLIGKKPTFEALEGRQMMSQVGLVDGMLILQGNAHGNNRLTVTPDSNGTTLFARADNQKAHYLLKDVKSIRVIGGEKADRVVIDSSIKKNSYIRVGAGRDNVQGGGGSDTILGCGGVDQLKGGNGDDLIVGGGQRADKIDAGAGDDPTKVWPHTDASSAVSVSSFSIVDVKTNKVVQTLTDGGTLNLAQLPAKYTVVANLSGTTSNASVRFTYDGQDLDHIENLAPYSLAGDDAGWSPRVGSHTLKATPYSGQNATGGAGAEKIVTFTVINDPGATPQEVNDDGGSTNSGGTTNSGGNTNTRGNTDTGGSNNNTGGDTNTGGNTGGNTNTGNDNGGGTVNQQNAPTAVISVLDSSVNAGMAIHVNGLKSTLKVGSPIQAQYEWDFGDAGSKYNTLLGFNAAHAYTTPGTYTITLKVTNSSGASDTVTTKVTITAAGRRFVYVSPTGDDTNNGSSADNAVKTFKRASQLVGDNTEVLFQRGGTYTTAGSMSLGHSNVVVGSYGTGNKPVIKYTGGSDYGAIFTTLGGKDVLVHDVSFDSSNTGTGDQGYNDGVRMGGKDIVVRDCTFVNVGYAINANGQPDGVLVQDNVCPNNNSVRGYFAWVQGADQVYLGNSAKDSLNLHNLRMGGADRVNISYNNFANPASTGGLRGTLTIHKGTYVTINHNTLADAALALGPLDAGAGLDDKGARLEWVVVENNTVNNAEVKVGNGTDHVMVRDNVINHNDDVAINLPGWSDQYDRGTSDVYIVHNTAVNTGTNGKFLKVSGPVTGVTMTNNLYVAPNFVTGTYDAAPVQIANGNLNGFTLICDNVWPAPTILDYAQGGVNYVGVSGTQSAYKTPSEWDAYSQVSHEQYKDVALANSYMITLGGTTAGADMSR